MKAPVVSPVTSNNNPHGETHEEKSRRVIGGVINNVVQDYRKHPKDGTIWTPTTAVLQFQYFLLITSNQNAKRRILKAASDNPNNLWLNKTAGSTYHQVNQSAVTVR
jgi:hypothetical protein